MSEEASALTMSLLLRFSRKLSEDMKSLMDVREARIDQVMRSASEYERDMLLSQMGAFKSRLDSFYKRICEKSIAIGTTKAVGKTNGHENEAVVIVAEPPRQIIRSSMTKALIEHKQQALAKADLYPPVPSVVRKVTHSLPSIRSIAGVERFPEELLRAIRRAGVTMPPATIAFAEIEGFKMTYAGQKVDIVLIPTMWFDSHIPVSKLRDKIFLESWSRENLASGVIEPCRLEDLYYLSRNYRDQPDKQIVWALGTNDKPDRSDAIIYLRKAPLGNQMLNLNQYPTDFNPERNQQDAILFRVVSR